jgi:predicted nucleic acid-binding protein
VIVIDASALIEWLLQTRTGGRVQDRIYSAGEQLHSPHLIDLEVTQVLRRYVRTGSITLRRGDEALRDLRDFSIMRYAHELFLSRIWELRDNLTAYDAVYVALAEALAAPLVTCDQRLASAPGLRARVEVLA